MHLCVWSFGSHLAHPLSDQRIHHLLAPAVGSSGERGWTLFASERNPEDLVRTYGNFNVDIII